MSAVVQHDEIIFSHRLFIVYQSRPIYPPLARRLFSVLREAGRSVALPGLARLNNPDNHPKNAQGACKNLHDEDLHEKAAVLSVRQGAR